MTHDDDPVIVVSGLPRSGTSMMMAMLAAGGVPLLYDDHRPADDSNPRGYHEYEPVKRIREETAWLHAARGRAVKIIHVFLDALPAEPPCRVIFMRRDLREVVTSQHRMIERLARRAGLLSDQQLCELYEREYVRTEDLFAVRANLDALYVDYATTIANPLGEAERVASFLGRQLDTAAMACVVDPALHRERAPAQH
jgi:hypothetical protein